MLHAMGSMDTATRRGAEAVYNAQLAAQPDVVAQGLLNAILPASAQPDGVRILSAVLLRQIADPKRPHWGNMSPPVRMCIMCIVYPQQV